MRLLLIVTMITTFLLGCGSSKVPEVNLSKVESQVVTKTQTTDKQPIRVAISSIVSPKETLTIYQPLLDYLEAKLNNPVVLLQRKTYKEVNELVQHDQADVAFVCSGGYVAGKYTFGMQLLAMPEVNGSATYQSFIITNAKSEANSIVDLVGRSFAFTDPMSFSGRIAPVHMLSEQRQDPAHFFGRTFFTYSHDNAIKAVDDGIADAAAVDSLIYHQAIAQNPLLGKRLKIVDKSLLVGTPPVVVNATLELSMRDKVQDALLRMSDTPEGKNALASLKYDRFVKPDEAAYNSLSSIWWAVKDKL